MASATATLIFLAAAVAAAAGDVNHTASGVTVRVLGRSGKIRVSTADDAAADVTFEVDSLTEVVSVSELALLADAGGQCLSHCPCRFAGGGRTTVLIRPAVCLTRAAAHHREGE